MRNPSPTSRSVKIIFSFFLAIFLTDAAVVSVSLRAEKKVFSSLPFTMMMVVAEVERRRRESNKKKRSFKTFFKLAVEASLLCENVYYCFCCNFISAFFRETIRAKCGVKAKLSSWVRVMLYADGGKL